MNDELRFDPDGYVVMDEFTGDDPDGALPAAVADELHARLHAAPGPVIDDATWTELVDVALRETAAVDIDELVDAPSYDAVPDDTTEGAWDDDGFDAWTELDDDGGTGLADPGTDDDPFEVEDDDSYDDSYDASDFTGEE